MIGLIALSSFNSCKKESEQGALFKLPSRKAGGNLPLFTTRDQINAHLKWIARGLAHWPKSHNFVSYVDSVTASSWNDSSLNSLAFIQANYIFKNSLKDTIDLRMPGHGFDTDGILGFYYYIFEMGNTVYIPEEKSLSGSKPFIVVAQDMYSDSITDMGLTGYFINSNGILDSVIVDEDNYDDYYIWLIDIWSPLEYSDLWESYGSGGDSLRKKSAQWKVIECDNDYDCENGEQYMECDCPGELYKLEIEVLRIRTDNHTYREKWLGGKYEFAISVGFIEDGDDRIYHPNNNLKIQKFKPKDVCTKKNGNRKRNSNNCDTADHYIGYIIRDKIKIDVNKECKMAIVFYERDRFHTRREEVVIGSSSNIIFNWQTTHCFGPLNDAFLAENDCYPYLWYRSHQSPYGSGVIDLRAIALKSSTGGSEWLGTNDEADIKIKLTKL